MDAAVSLPGAPADHAEGPDPEEGNKHHHGARSLPQTVQRRRPSLSAVLSADPDESPDTYQQRLAAKVGQAAQSLREDDSRQPAPKKGGVVRVDAPNTSDGGDCAHHAKLLLFSAFSLCGCITMYVTQQQLVEQMVGAELAAAELAAAVSPISDPRQHFALNEPTGVFVGVVSIIFALMYTSVYNESQVRQSAIRNCLALEAGGVHTAMLLVRSLDADDMVNKTRALLLFSSYVEQLAAELFYKRNPQDQASDFLPSSIESLYAAVPFLAQIASDGEGDEMDRVLIQRSVDALNRVCEARHTRTSEERSEISPATFSFLSLLALFTFFGILFLQFGSTSLTHAVVLMTGVSLWAAMWVLLDVAMPWRGWIVVDVGIFNSIRREISLVLDQEALDADIDPVTLGLSPLQGRPDSASSEDDLEGGYTPRPSGGGIHPVLLREESNDHGGRLQPTNSVSLGVDKERHLEIAIRTQTQTRRGLMVDTD